MIKQKVKFNIDFLNDIKKNIKLTEKGVCDKKCKYLISKSTHKYCILLDNPECSGECKKLFFNFFLPKNIPSIYSIIDSIVTFEEDYKYCSHLCEFYWGNNICSLFFKKLNKCKRCKSCLNIDSQNSYI